MVRRVKKGLGMVIEEKNMDAWTLSNKISEIGYKIDSLAGVAEIVAERLTDNAESSACWVIAENLQMYGEKLEELSSIVMKLNKPQEVTKKKK